MVSTTVKDVPPLAAYPLLSPLSTKDTPKDIPGCRSSGTVTIEIQ